MAENTYLLAPYKDREAVKALGARWDPVQKSWFVPAGQDLAPFRPWLPTGSLTPLVSSSAALTAPAARGLRLSELLGGVAQAISQVFTVGQWTMVEVVDARVRNGHVYLEVSERTATGEVCAKANAVMWASTAARILPAFERATGAQVGPGIKLLLRMRPVFKAQYGFSLEVDDIDPDYTLGDLEAKKREIRAKLQALGLWDQNRTLPPPWDFQRVLVVAPQGAAGLGDFEAEALRLQQHGVCDFTVVHSRFQGEGAAEEIRTALLQALDSWRGPAPDAVVIIRGGGAVNDLAWLNDFELARCLCELPVPVWTGIGHERDNTVLDEVAQQRFDTPSKVIGGIVEVVRSRARQAQEAFAVVTVLARQSVVQLGRTVDAWRQGVVSGAKEELLRAQHAIGKASEDVRWGASRVLAEARHGADHSHAAVLERAQRLCQATREQLDRQRQEVAQGAARVVEQAKTQSEAWMREIAGQGPDKTLGRGFALVMDVRGRPISRAAAVQAGQALSIQWRDGQVAARSSGPATANDPSKTSQDTP